MLRRWIAPIIGLMLSACQSSMIRSFDKVHPGMDKHQVLETVGNPNATTRYHGKDRWVYRFYDDGIRFDKEIHFADGIVVYSGEFNPPAEKSAAAADKRRDEVEEKFQADADAREEARKKNAELYRKYEEQSRGKGEKVDYMPAFVDLK